MIILCYVVSLISVSSFYFLVCGDKDSANRTQKLSLLEFFVERGENSVAVRTRVRCRRNWSSLPRELESVAHRKEKRCPWS